MILIIKVYFSSAGLGLVTLTAAMDDALSTGKAVGGATVVVMFQLQPEMLVMALGLFGG